MIQDANYWKNRPTNDTYMDWHTDSKNWIEEYWGTRKHPHRKQIVNILRKLKPWGSLLEVGCNCGANLYNINKNFSNVELSGIDANQQALDFGKSKLPGVYFQNLSVEDTGFVEVDIVLFDAVLMYVSDKDIYRILKDCAENTQKAIIICDWFDESKLGVIKGGHWTRNYPELFKEFGWKLREKKIIWPSSQKWMDYGRIFIVTK